MLVLGSKKGQNRKYDLLKICKTFRYTITTARASPKQEEKPRLVDLEK